MKKIPEIFLKHIQDSIEDVENYTKDVTIESFLHHTNKMLQDAVVRKIEIIGEAVKNLPEDYTSQHSETSWKKIAGMRNKLIHEYFGVDLELVFEVVKNDLPTLKKQIQELLKPQN